MGRFKKRGVDHFGIDYFRAVVGASEKSALFTLSANSDFMAFDRETHIKLLNGVSDKWKRYYIVEDAITGISLAFVGLGGVSTDSYTPSRDFLEVTGQGLILRNGPIWFLDMADKLQLEIEKFTRVDVCVDLINITVPYVHEKLLSPECKRGISKIYNDTKTGKAQTLYIGVKSRERNSYQLIRIYDKIADSVGDKNKAFLYPSHEKYESVTRLEVEMREEQAKFWTREKLVDTNYIFAVIIKKFYRFNYQFFGFLKFDDFSKVQKAENSLYQERLEKIRQRKKHMMLYGTSFKSEEEQKLWITTFRAYGKRLIGDGYTLDQIVEMLDFTNGEE